jgi:hypothetical protein
VAIAGNVACAHNQRPELRPVAGRHALCSQWPRTHAPEEPIMRIRTTMMLGLSLASAAFLGCSGGDDRIASVVPGIETGTLEQAWTIEGTKDPAKCTQYKADRFRMVVFDAKGEVHATKFAPCNAFQMKLDLKTDTYTGNATFIDAQGLPVSRTIELPPFNIAEDRKAALVVDFKPADMRPQ